MIKHCNNLDNIKVNCLTMLIIGCIFCAEKSYGAVSQILNDNFFQNPAELSLINKLQVTAGNVFINPSFKFEGTSYGADGSAKSNLTDYLPYILSAYRTTDRLVFGVNATPSIYGHIDWSVDSVVSQASTLTDFLYYRVGFQSSYQFTDSLALGLGFNIEDDAVYKLNLVIPGEGNQINSVSGVNYTGDFGVFYKINTRNYLSIAGYTQVKTYGHGYSSVEATTVNDLSLNIAQAPVVYIGLEHLNDKWRIGGKIYWSGWSILQSLDFTNTTTGSYVVPTNWKDVWSFQITTRYALIDKLALLGAIIYETNPVLLATNAIGYPLAASGSLSGGFDFALRNDLSIQAIYSYGALLPNSPINNANSVGTINAHFQAGVLQLIYKT